ncbi:MAG: hypothetical protein IKQ48_05705 [Paludibacteraceae bacterium]|nr:hypothetical protein [Paludibacteraceae bacterium]
MKKFSTIQHALMAGKKLLLSVIAISISATVFAIDWDSYAWLGDGAGGGAYSEMYKVAPAEGQNVVNIQKPGFAAEDGIYTNFPAGISACSLGEKCAIDGAGVVLYLSAFTAKETDVTVTAGDKEYAFTVFYKNGQGGQQDDTEYTITVIQPAQGGTIAADATKAVYHTTITLTATPVEGKQLDKWIVTDAESNPVAVSKNKFDMPKSNVTVTATFKDKVDLEPATYSGSKKEGETTFEWSVTRNTDQTLTFAISWDKELEGAAPQVNIKDNYIAMTATGKSATYTTTDIYDDGDQLNFFFYVAYTGAAARIDVQYTVGESNETDTTAFESVYNNNETRTRKVIENGTIVIIKDGIRYNALGTKL